MLTPARLLTIAGLVLASAGAALAQTPPPATGEPPLGTPPAGTPTTAPDGTPLTPTTPGRMVQATGVCQIHGPVLTPTDFNVAAGLPVADMSAVVLEDGRIRLYVFAQGQGIVSATSITPEGLAFVADPGQRLGDGSGMPRIVRRPEGGYRLFFISGDGIKSATSEDGLNFTVEAGFRISKEQAGLTDAAGNLQALSGATILRLQDGRYRMYFSDLPRPGEGPGGHRIKSAVSTDMLTWVMEEGLRMGVGATSLGESAEHPSALAHADGRMTLYYGKFLGPGSSNAEGMYFSTSNDGLTFETETLGVFRGNDPDLIHRQDGTLLAYYGDFDPVIGGIVYVAACPDPGATPATSATVTPMGVRPIRVR